LLPTTLRFAALPGAALCFSNSHSV
jgi:hypothetical protein